MLALVGCGASLVHRRIPTQTFRGPVHCTLDKPYVSTKLDPQGWLQQGGAANTTRGSALPVVEDQCSIFVVLWKTLPKAQQTQISSGFTKEIVEIYPTSQISEILKHKKDRYIFK